MFNPYKIIIKRNPFKILKRETSKKATAKDVLMIYSLLMPYFMCKHMALFLSSRIEMLLSTKRNVLIKTSKYDFIHAGRQIELKRSLSLSLFFVFSVAVKFN